jgi:arginine dihydrolase
LVDPRLFHLDLALAVLDDERDHIAYYPEAFSPPSRRLLAELFPDALIANEHDAFAFGLNAVSDGLHVFIPSGARQVREDLAAAGYWPVSVDLSELIKSGGNVKCCTQEIRPARIATPESASSTDEVSSLIISITSQAPAGGSS